VLQRESWFVVQLMTGSLQFATGEHAAQTSAPPGRAEASR
jgi:hypothetical protein